MATAERISTKDNAVQADLAQHVGKIVEVRGILASGDPINKLDGEALQKDIQFQKEKQHRKYLQKDPYIKFKINNANLELKDKDSAERLVWQMIYESPEDHTKSLTAETKSMFTIGYRNGDKLIPIKRSSLEGKRFAYNQGVTLTFEVYQSKETKVCGIGLANIIFDEKPSFYNAETSIDRIGACESQNWATEVEDFSDDAPTAAPANEPANEPVNETPQTEASADAADWGSVWN